MLAEQTERRRQFRPSSHMEQIRVGEIQGADDMLISSLLRRWIAKSSNRTRAPPVERRLTCLMRNDEEARRTNGRGRSRVFCLISVGREGTAPVYPWTGSSRNRRRAVADTGWARRSRCWSSRFGE